MRYRLNILPEESRTGKFADLSLFTVVLIFVLYLAGLAGIGVLYEKRYITAVNTLTSLNYQKNQLLFQEQSAGRILERINQIQIRRSKDRNLVKVLNDLVERRIEWSGVMAQITHIVPDGVWLQTMSSTGEGRARRVQFRGMGTNNQWVARFLFYLENHPDFSDVKLEYSRLTKIGEKELFSFEVNALLTVVEEGG